MNVLYSMAERGNKVLGGMKIVNELILTQGDHHGLSAHSQILGINRRASLGSHYSAYSTCKSSAEEERQAQG